MHIEPSWKLNVPSIVGLIGVTIVCAGNVWGKANRSELDDLKEKVVVVQREAAVSAKVLENIAAILSRLEQGQSSFDYKLDKMREKQQETLEEVYKRNSGTPK